MSRKAFALEGGLSPQLAVGLGLVLALEGAVLHLWVAQRSAAWAWAITAINVVTLVWLWREHRATRQARALLCKVNEVNFLSGPGRGVILIKLDKDEDRVLGFIASSGDRDLLTVETTRGAAQTISTGKYSLTSRGGRGRELLQRGEFTRVLPQAPELPVLSGS